MVVRFKNHLWAYIIIKIIWINIKTYCIYLIKNIDFMTINEFTIYSKSKIDQEIKKVKLYQLSRHFTLGNIYKYFDKYQHNRTDNTNNV